MNDEILVLEYNKILEDLDSSYFDPDHTDREVKQGLSGLFLPSVPAGYSNAKNKIMVIGRETRGWSVLKGRKFSNLQEYIGEALSTHRNFFDNELRRSTGDKGMTFHNFMRAVAAKSGGEGLLYSNLFCFSWNKKYTAASPFFDEIKSVSERLLKAQIKLLSPDIIIFANGMASVPYRRDYFPISGENNCCLNPRDYSSDGIPSRQLWEFDLYGRIRCLRIHHPSARSKEAQKARRFLIDLLPEKPGHESSSGGQIELILISTRSSTSK